MTMLSYLIVWNGVRNESGSWTVPMSQKSNAVFCHGTKITGAPRTRQVTNCVIYLNFFYQTLCAAETLIIDNHCLYAGWQADCGLMLQFYKGRNTAAAVPRRFLCGSIIGGCLRQSIAGASNPSAKTALELRLLMLLYFFDKTATATWPSYFLIYERWHLPNFQGSVLHHNLCLLMLAA